MIFLCLARATRLIAPATALILFWSITPTPAAEVFTNTQVETSPLLTPAAALAKMRVPDGFVATLFAGEPEVQQPIGMTTDARGRLWVAENYTYAEQKVNFATNLHDRIVIFEDTDGDGRNDRRTVFWDRAQKLTSVAVGFGGVYALCPPQLLFLPDRNGDDIPDGEPVVLLDGWDAAAVRHNIVNGLKWGPDGWLYGRHGILATSRVGKPGTPQEKRTALNCAIWRFHPTTHAFEVVAQGTTNPWGHDWDENGQLFFINTVIGHLWHVIPGAYYKRMYGEHFNQSLYGLIDQNADHVHWNTNETWDEIRKLGVTTTTSQAGGGHAHSGFMFYLGEQWPERFRNTAFTINYHGRRLNNDVIFRHGATYSARHNPDMVFSDDIWFRGIDLLQGPAGEVYISDWADLGECHDQDGIHRTSGRIYRVAYGKESSLSPRDLSQLSDAELVELPASRNEWLVRQARLVLQERAASGRNLSGVHATLRSKFAQENEVTRKLRYLWALHVSGGTTEEWLLELLADSEEQVRTWAIHLLVDHKPASAKLLARFTSLAIREKSGLVLTFLASVLQKSTGDRWPLAQALAAHGEFKSDAVFPFMVWYGVEPVLRHPTATAFELVRTSELPMVRTFLARRWAEELEKPPADKLLQLVAGSDNLVLAEEILSGFAGALKGLQRATPPPAWPSVVARFRNSARESVRDLVRELSVVFGDQHAMDDLRQMVTDQTHNLEMRRRALQSIVRARSAPLPMLTNLLNETGMAAEAVRALGLSADPSIPGILLDRYSTLQPPQARLAVVHALAARPNFAEALLAAVKNGLVRTQDVSTFQIRQIRSFRRSALNAQLDVIWPGVRPLSSEKKSQIERYEKLLTPESLQPADLVQGRQLFGQVCGACHVLFGEGARIGPELTGSDRQNLGYLLENILDPSGMVAQDYRMSVVTLKDDRILNGVMGAKTARTLELQTPTEKVVLEQKDIESMTTSELSLMPDGLLESLTVEQVRNLIAYLMRPDPLPVPAASK